MASFAGPVIRLFEYTGHNYSEQLLAMTATQVYSYNHLTNQWTGITGIALTGDATTRAQWASHKGVTIFTNEQHDLPRKYTGSGTTVALGGTPPKAVAVCDYMKHLFLWNVITSEGTFPRQGLFSLSYDTDWSSCNGFEINLDETPGEVLSALAQGPLQMVYKADGVAAVRFVGGKVRFQQEMLAFDEGILAPLSLQMVGNKGHVMLATDYQLYQIDMGVVKALPPKVIDKLQKTMDPLYADRCTSAVDSDNDTYYLFYRVPGDDHASARIAYNFRTGEFAHRTYRAHEWLDAISIKFEPTQPTRSFGACLDNLVYEINDPDAIDDAGTPITRYITSDWQNFDQNIQKILHRVELRFTRVPHTRARISIAIDDREEWLYEQSFDLKGHLGQDTVSVSYEPAQPCEGTTFNLKIRLYHDRAGRVAEIRSATFKWEPVSENTDTAEFQQSDKVI